MAASSVSDFPHQSGGDMIDLDHYMTSPVFQYDNDEPPGDKCVIDAGSFGKRTSPKHNGPPSEYKDSFRAHDHVSYMKPSPPGVKRSPPKESRLPNSDYNASYNRARDYERTTEGSESSFTYRECRDNQKQYSLDSGVSDGGRCRHHRKSGFHSNVDFYERRRKKDFARSNHKLRNRNTLQDVRDERSQSSIMMTLKAQQEKIDRLAALCEECLQPKESKESCSSELSSSVATEREQELVASDKRALPQDRVKIKMAPKVNETKTYKIIMRKLDELNQHFACKQQAAPAQVPPPARRGKPNSSSGSKSSEISVSDKGVCTSLTQIKDRKTGQDRKTKTLARGENRRSLRKQCTAPSTTSSAELSPKTRRKKSAKCRNPVSSIDSSNPESRHRGFGSKCYAKLKNERSDSLNSVDARRFKQIYTVFAQNDFELLSPHRSRIGDHDANMFGIKDYNLNDPISFYNRAKRLSTARGGEGRPVSPEVNLCTLCRGYWSRIHLRGRDFCRQMLCRGDGVSLASELMKKN